MLGSVTIEVAIGIIFVFILVSIICSMIREGIEAIIKTRAAYLENAIRNLMDDKDGNGLAKDFYNHPLISGLFSKEYKPRKDKNQQGMLASGGNLPSYIPSWNFAEAVMDIAARGPKTDGVSGHPDSPQITLETVRANIQNLDSPFVQRALLTAIDSAQGDLDKARKNLEAWYNGTMDRISGWYKRATYWIILVIGLLVSVGLNIDTIAIANYLYRDDAARTVLVTRAEEAAKDTSLQNLTYEFAKAEVQSLRFPIGWEGADESNGLAIQVLGWLITALAATMGAPFWFDMLNKIMVIRSTVKPHEKSLEEASEDRQMKSMIPTNVLAGAFLAPNFAGNVNANPAPMPAIANLRDREVKQDGCAVDMNQVITPDNELPPAEGGVA